MKHNNIIFFKIFTINKINKLKNIININKYMMKKKRKCLFIATFDTNKKYINEGINIIKYFIMIF